MILIDTHIWIWWVMGDPKLQGQYFKCVQENEDNLMLSEISYLEVATKYSKGQLELPAPLGEWLKDSALVINPLNITPEIATEAANLPGEFHKDPADRVIVATARIYDLLLVTVDRKILDYPHVKTL